MYYHVMILLPQTTALFEFPTEWSCYFSMQNETITVQKAFSTVWYLRPIKLLGIFTSTKCESTQEPLKWQLLAVKTFYKWKYYLCTGHTMVIFSKALVWDDLWSGASFHRGLKSFCKIYSITPVLEFYFY